MSEIRTREKTVTVFVVGDKEFDSKEDAQNHLTKMRERLKYAYLVVRHNPDLTEMRGFQNTQIIGVARKTHVIRNAVIAYCLDTFGPPLIEPYGRPEPAWSIGEAQAFTDIDELHAWIDQTKAPKGLATIHRETTGPIFIDGFGRVTDPQYESL